MHQQVGGFHSRGNGLNKFGCTSKPGMWFALGAAGDNRFRVNPWTAQRVRQSLTFRMRNRNAHPASACIVYADYKLLPPEAAPDCGSPRRVLLMARGHQERSRLK